MAINTKQPPDDAAAALDAGLGQIRGAAAQLGMAEAAGAGAGTPHESYNLGLDSIEAKKGVAAAEPIGWRYLLAGGPAGRGLAAEVHSRPSGYEFAGLNEGPFVQQVADQIEKLRGKIGNKDYEPRLLRIPALYIAALWLKGKNDDLFIPLQPSNPAVEPHRVYSRKDFETAIETAAKEMKSAEPPKKEDAPHAP
jgi:hypothetical protein